MAVWQRKPPKGLLRHIDRDSQYTSKEHRGLLKAHHIEQSITRKGNCWDNASLDIKYLLQWQNQIIRPLGFTCRFFRRRDKTIFPPTTQCFN